MTYPRFVVDICPDQSIVELSRRSDVAVEKQMISAFSVKLSQFIQLEQNKDNPSNWRNFDDTELKTAEKTSI